MSNEYQSLERDWTMKNRGLILAALLCIDTTTMDHGGHDVGFPHDKKEMLLKELRGLLAEAERRCAKIATRIA